MMLQNLNAQILPFLYGNIWEVLIQYVMKKMKN